MSTPDPSQPPSGDANSADAPSAAVNVVSPVTTTAPSGLGKLVVAVGLAAVLVWLVMLVVGYPFFAEPQVAPAGGAGPPMPTEAERAAMLRRAYLNLTTLMAMSGGFFGVGLALAAGVRHRPAGGALLAVFAAAVAGSGAGAAAAWCGERMFELPQLLALDKSFPGAKDAVIQGTCWGLVGFGVALGLTLSGCRHPRSLIGGTLGGVISGPLYSIVSAVAGILLPAGETAGLVPNSMPNRLLWLLTAAVCIAAGIGINPKSRRPSAEG